MPLVPPSFRDFIRSILKSLRKRKLVTARAFSPRPSLESFEPRQLLSASVAWAAALTPTTGSHAAAVTYDAAGSLIVAGYFSGTMDFDSAHPNTVTATTNGGDDAFVAKYSSAGALLWARTFGGSYADHASAVTTDAAGNVYVTGYYSGMAAFDGANNSGALTAAGIIDAFVLKLTSTGNTTWVKSLGGTDYDQGLGIAVDNAGNTFTVGTFLGTADFDPSIATANLTSAGVNNVFISKLSTSGSFAWVKHISGAEDVAVMSLKLDSSGNLNLAGAFSGTMNAGGISLASAGGYDAYFASYDSSGNVRLARRVGGTGDDMALSIAVTSTGDFLLAGHFTGSADLDPNAGTVTVSASASNVANAFVARFDSTGNYLWHAAVPSNSWSYATSVALDPSGNVILGGYFGGAATFGAAGAASSAGASDMYVAKLNSSGTFQWVRTFGAAGIDQIYSVAANAAGEIAFAGKFTGQFTLAGLTPPVVTAPLGSAVLLGKITDSALGPTAPTGNVDWLDSTLLIGWAFDANAGAGATSIRVDIDGQTRLVKLADLSRPDLISAVGSASHGFRLALPLLTTGSHTIAVYALDDAAGSSTLITSRTIVSAGFAYDERYYLSHNPDIMSAVQQGLFSSGWQHYALYGAREGRVASPYFDTQYYLAHNPDVAGAVQAGLLKSAFDHFVAYGWLEGRSPGAFYSESYYLASNPDIAAGVASGALRSGFQHFILYGQFEGRAASADFCESWYLAKYSDINWAVSRGLFRNGLEHWLTSGRLEGRLGHAS